MLLVQVATNRLRPRQTQQLAEFGGTTSIGVALDFEDDPGWTHLQLLDKAIELLRRELWQRGVAEGEVAVLVGENYLEQQSCGMTSFGSSGRVPKYRNGPIGVPSIYLLAITRIRPSASFGTRRIMR